MQVPHSALPPDPPRGEMPLAQMLQSTANHLVAGGAFASLKLRITGNAG